MPPKTEKNPTDPNEPRETASALLNAEMPESLSAEAERREADVERLEAKVKQLEAEAADVDRGVHETVLLVKGLGPNAEESKRVTELNAEERTSFEKFRAALENIKWKVIGIYTPPEKLEAMRLISKAQKTKKNPKQPDQVQALQENLKKALSQPAWGPTIKEEDVYSESRVEHNDPFIRSLDNWRPSVEDLSPAELKELVETKIQWDDIRSEFAKNPNDAEGYSQKFDVPIPKNVIKMMETIFEITGLAPATKENAVKIWEAGMAGAVMRTGEDSVNRYFKKLLRKYPEFELDTMEKRHEDVEKRGKETAELEGKRTINEVPDEGKRTMNERRPPKPARKKLPDQDQPAA
jgi:hypothetical protein